MRVGGSTSTPDGLTSARPGFPYGGQAETPLNLPGFSAMTAVLFIDLQMELKSSSVKGT